MSNRLVIDRRRGLWLGVCHGLADYSGVPVGLIRIVLLILTIVSLDARPMDDAQAIIA